MLVVDLLSALMLALSSLVALAHVLYGYAEAAVRTEHPLRAAAARSSWSWAST